MSELFLAYNANFGYDLYTASFNGQYWYNDTKIADQPGGIKPGSNSAPAAIVYNGTLFLVYVGDHTANLYTAWYDGQQWHGNTKIADQPGGIKPKTNVTPGLAVFDDLLYVVYAGPDTNDLYTARYDGQRWSGNVRIKDQPGGSGVQPSYDTTVASIGYGDYLRLFLTDEQNLPRQITFDGGAWSGGGDTNAILCESQALPPGTVSTISAGPFQQDFCLVYPSLDGSNDLCTIFGDGKQWYNCGMIKGQNGGVAPRSPDAPGVAFFNDALYLIYNTGSTDFYVAWFDGNSWYGNVMISSQPGGITPKSLSNPAAVVF